MPGENLPTWLLTLSTRSPNRVLARLRNNENSYPGEHVMISWHWIPARCCRNKKEVLLAGLRQVLKSR